MPTTIINPSSYYSLGNRGQLATEVPFHPQGCCCPACSGLQCLDRTRFFAGQLLSEADLNNEQEYWLAKSRLHNRYLVGWGVVCGLQVVCGECDGWVTVRSGYAIDPCGNDVIVCADQNFNVAQAIRDCCSPAKTPGANCQPLRYNPSPNCAGTLQKWCITLEYQEQASRLTTPLTNSATSCSCGCSNGNGNGKSKAATSSNGSQSCKTSSSSTKTATTVPAGACEATRTVEGFQLGIISADDLAAEEPTPAPGSLTYNVEQCTVGLLKLVKLAPDLNDSIDPQVAYQKTCSYLTVVTNYFAKSANITHCRILDAIGNITVPSGKDAATYVGIVAEIVKAVAYSFLDCICYSLLPPCPPNPCDKRIVLACVTVRDGSIVDICHFTGRKQLITLHTLGYWLGPLLDNFRAEIARLLALVCCGGENRIGGFSFDRALYDKEMVTTAGFDNVAGIHRVAAHYVAQTMGASVVNAVSPGSRAVDLRPLIYMSPETAQAHLKEQGFERVDVQSVSEDPSWDAEAIASSAQFAPAAVSANQRITMYTSGSQVVGFAVVDPTTAKIQDLQDQINALQGQMGQWDARAAATAQTDAASKAPKAPKKP